MEKIIKKLETRQRITQKLKSELYDFQKKINSLPGMETLEDFAVFVEKDRDGDDVNDILFAVKNHVFGLFLRFDFCNTNEEPKDIDEYINDIGIKKTLSGLKEFLKEFEKISNFSEYGKPLKELL